MRAVFHIGAHRTDDGAIFQCLAQNRGRLQDRGIFLPPPGRYRPVIRETVQALNGQPASPDMQNLMLDSMLNSDADPELLFFSFDSFLGGARGILGEEGLYPFAEARTQRYRALFPEDRVEFAIGVSNPATFLPDAFAMTGAEEFEAFLGVIDPLTLRWSDLVERIIDAVPDADVTVWSNEDTPFIWPELLRAVVHIGPDVPLRGENDFVLSLLTPEGGERLNEFMRQNPPKSVDQRRRIVAAFLEKFARAEAVDVILDHVGWTDEYVEALTDFYEEDLFTIERMPEVRFISP